MPEDKEDPKKKGGEDPKKKKVERKTVVKEVTPPPMKKDTFGKFEDGINQQRKHIKEIKFTAYGEDKSKKKETTIEVIEEGCFCGNHYFDDDWLKGDNVIHSRKDSKVKPQGEQQKPIGIILHRLEGWDTSGGIQKSIGTHFFVDKPFRDRKNIDGEIFQPVPLNKYTGHILDPTNNARKGYPHSNLTSRNTIGIEVAGMTYHKDGENYTLASKDDKGVYRIIPASDRQPLTDGWKRKSDGKVFYWDQLTKAQIKSTACLVKLLMDKYELTVDDIYAHEDIQSKSAGEGGVVKEAIMPYLKGEKKF